jgi:DNA helicase-2/ATP-dependent DNA helicase PcrA
LRQHGSHLGLRPDFEVVADDNDRIAILKEMQVNEIAQIDAPEDYLKFIDWLFIHGINFEELRNNFSKQQHEFLKEIFHNYLDALIKGNYLDFGAMLYFTRKLLSDKKRIAHQINTVYRYVCVDEFQDTNPVQYKILRLIYPDTNSNLFVVADDDQIVFQWNGADPKRLEELKRDYNPEEVQLPENYRCPTEIVELANRLIAHNRRANKKVGIAHNTEKTNAVCFEKFNNFNDEVAGLAIRLSQIPKNQRGKCLVIARSNKLLTEVKKVLNGKDIRAEIISKQQNFSSPFVLFIYFALKMANSADSRSSLNKLCATASFIGGESISSEEVIADANAGGIMPLRSFFEKISKKEKVGEIAKEGIELLCNSLNYKQFIANSFEIFESLNKSEEINEPFPDYENDKKNWDSISEEIYRYHGKTIPLHIFLQEMDMTPKSKEPSADCVRLQTVHTAKGAEFENVYVIGLAQYQFPTYFALKSEKEGDDSSIQEERRNCFVAITRASKTLYMSYAKYYFNNYPKEPSRFLKEMGLLDNERYMECNTKRNSSK